MHFCAPTFIRQGAAPEFFCPITKLLLVDPVFCSDGYVYERAAIQAR